MSSRKTGQTTGRPDHNGKNTDLRHPHFVRRLIEITLRQQQTQRALLDWLLVEYTIEKPSNKLLALADLD